MDEASVEDATARGYEPPRNTQFSIFLDNRVGKLAKLIEIFDGQALNLVALSVMDATDHAVVRVVTSRSDLARRLLERHHMPFSEADLLVVELRAGQSLTRLCKALLQAEVNICYAYPVMSRPHGGAVIALHTDDQLLAGQILRKKMFTLLGENDLGDNATPTDSEGPTTI